MSVEEQTQYDVYLAMRSGVYDKAGQRITIPNRTITKLALPLSKEGSPSGNVIFQIRNIQAGNASEDTILATKTWGLANDLTDTAAWKEVTFDSPVALNQEVRLIVIVTGGSNGNRVRLWKINSNQKSSEWFCWNFGDIWTWDEAPTPETQEGAYKYTYLDAATVTIQAITDIVTTTARGHGNVTDLGDASVTEHGHCWDLEANPTPDTSDSKTTLGTKATVGTFVSEITGLTEGQTYAVRAYATNSYGTSYSSELTFVAGTAGATSYPDIITDPLRRVSGIRHTFWSGIGGESVYQSTLSLGGISTTYVSAISERKSPNAIAPTPLPSGAGYQQSDYEAWLRKMDIDTILMVFGHFPTYTEWVNWIRFGKAKK